MIEKLNKKDYYKIIELGKIIKENFSLNAINKNEVVYIYKKENLIIGFIQISCLYETLDIINIVVSEEYRRKKIGQMLLDFVIKEHTPEKIMIEVRESNEAIKFYEKNDFKKIRKIKKYYINEDAIVMERIIR